jgi:hypothetical protein
MERNWTFETEDLGRKEGKQEISDLFILGSFLYEPIINTDLPQLLSYGLSTPKRD